jgi:8-oxo-dGTP pyrophosphatase MutT (NUDIX family)
MSSAWKRNPEYWGTAGAGVIPLAEDTGRFLVALRSAYVMEPHTWGTIGGKLDAVGGGYSDDDDAVLEDPEDAALREFEEETGSELPVELIALYMFRDPAVGFTYHNFLGIVPEEFEPEANWETDEWAWVTLPELLALEPKHFGLHALLQDEPSTEILLRHA